MRRRAGWQLGLAMAMAVLAPLIKEHLTLVDDCG